MIRVAFLVTSLSGTGHLVRTAAVARAAREAGLEVRLISGGRPPGHLDIGDLAMVQLPPLSVPDLDFSTPRGPDGGPAGPTLMAERARLIVDTLERFRPHALVTETFPLGRRKLAAEFEAAIAAVPEAQVLASVRDVPEPPSPAVAARRIEAAAARLRARYAAVLVHGDPLAVDLADAWPLPADLRARVRYTGYVGAAEGGGGDGPALEPGTVLVSVGGGPLGRRLLDMALEAAARTPSLRWHLLVGGGDAAAHAEALSARAPANLAAEPVRRGFRAMLRSAAVSVSLAGYNTVMDLAACDTPALLVPFAGRGEREQTLRARALAERAGFAVLEEEALSAEALAGAVTRLAHGPRRPPFPFATDGAARAAAAIRALATERAA